jgi:myosin protein heavy chain
MSTEVYNFQELEALKTEFEESLDATAAVQELRNKREDELRDLKKSLDDAQKKYDGNLYELRAKHNQQTGVLNEELENVKKVNNYL